MTKIQKHFFKIQQSIKTVSLTSSKTVDKMINDFSTINFCEDIIPVGYLTTFFINLIHNTHHNYHNILKELHQEETQNG